MSLLDGGAHYEECLVFPEVTATDEDGNLITKPVPKYITVVDPDTNEEKTVLNPAVIQAKARFQVQGQSGTSARRAEQDNEGFESEKVYRVRFPRSFTREHGIIGAQAQLEWRGERWSIFGDANHYNSSPRTRHVDYTIKRY